MVYQNKLVAAVKVNGQILREIGQSVLIPFGSEYSVFLKNLNSVRVKVKVSIDGTDATGGTWLVVQANSTMDLERFIKDGDFAEGRRFKFIERSKDVEAHRGVKIDDGLVRIEYQTERIRPVVDVPYVNYYPVPTPYPQPWYPRPHWIYGMGTNSSTRSVGASGSKNYTANDGAMVTETSCNVNYSDTQNSMGEKGITVQGSVSNQSFVSVSDFETSDSDVLVLQLRGVVAGKNVAKAITVQTKRTCSSCGKVSKSGIEFCPRCGTAL